MKKYISKLLMGTITNEELKALREWLDNPKNQAKLENYVQDYHDLNMSLLKENVSDAYEKTINRIELTDKPVRRLLPNWAKYAAVAVLFIGIGFLYQQNFFATNSNAALVPNEEQITLELENGTIKTINVAQSKVVKDDDGNVIGNQEKSQLNYSKTNKLQKVVYNTLNIPKGKTFRIALSDGTLVVMNAGSSLRYPISFSPVSARKVFLKGEAYFDVTKDNSRPFIVNVDNLDIEVLGTEFNVSSYNEDANIEVVLVEGAVQLNANNELERGSPVELSPGQRGSYARVSKNINIDAVKTALYTSWIQGHLVFRDLSFNQILSKLERHYNIEIENENAELGKEIFNASFNKVKIEEILSFFNDTHKIEYEIKNNKVFIK
ncbi:FecR domain-containing protein [Aurantibacter sp.]|uniref:FecR family protein n=1 Tax=Aurantibacter sp. TaxID=2807103 RepID=UPI00326626A2